jgi:hypothetical protein
MCPDAIEEEVKLLQATGVPVDLLSEEGQCYARVMELPAPSPPWDRTRYDILVAVPAAYDFGGLDAFYLGLPYQFEGGTHPRVDNGAIITLEGRQWRLVSWHYADGKPWVRGQDNLASHIEHCKGFFLGRGATNDYR